MSKVKEMQAGRLSVKVFDSRKALGEEAAKEAAAAIRDVLSKKSEVNIIFASAPSQNEFLEGLLNDKTIEWGKVNGFHLDEYVGLDPKAPQGFGNFLKDRLFGKIKLKSENYLNGNAKDIEAECERYTELLEKYPADIICMGIGENGHLAFNDPHVASFNDAKKVKVVELDDKCRMQQVHDGCFDSIDKVPAHALTLTIPSLTAGKYIFCMVPGRTKAEAVANTVKGEISEKCPASIMRNCDNAILYADTDSASMLG